MDVAVISTTSGGAHTGPEAAARALLAIGCPLHLIARSRDDEALFLAAITPGPDGCELMTQRPPATARREMLADAMSALAALELAYGASVFGLR